MRTSLLLAALLRLTTPTPQCESSAAEHERWMMWCEDLDGNPVRNDDGTWSCLDEEGNVYVDDDSDPGCNDVDTCYE